MIPSEAIPAPVLEKLNIEPLGVDFRAGYQLESAPLKACLLYLQGLGDSVRNHQPFFNRLSQSGYRIIYFDYMGQGGSDGRMNDTRVQVELPSDATRPMKRRYETKDKFQAIPEQAEWVWRRYRSVRGPRGEDCQGSPKIAMGWSTGGLAAFRMAHEKTADAVILIAPGIHPKVMVGEASRRWDKMVFLQPTITEPTLTRNRFVGTRNPHVDSIRPTSPAHVPRFAGNLVLTAQNSRHWKIDSSIPGLALLSGEEDSYVHLDPTLRTLSQNAPHFEIKVYPGALHELDNELPEVTDDLYQRAIRFLDRVVEKRGG